MSTHNLCFEQKYENFRILIEKLSVLGGEISNIFEKACFRNVDHYTPYHMLTSKDNTR